MRPPLSRLETLLLALCCGLLLLALAAPGLAQPALQHDFADRRALAGIPFACDVLSNLPFALAGLGGMAALVLAGPRALSNAERAMAWLFFVGLLLTAFASIWYHLRPDDAGLALDRGGMAIAFAGLLGLAVAGRISGRAGAALGLALLAAGPLAVAVWARSGNVLPWAVLQFGGMGLVLWLACMRPRPGALRIRWSLVILAYGAAKLLEVNDHTLYTLTGELVSGHTLKHLVASLAAWPVVCTVWALAPARQNAAGQRQNDNNMRRAA